jgi:hypothetical protein
VARTGLSLAAKCKMQKTAFLQYEAKDKRNARFGNLHPKPCRSLRQPLEKIHVYIRGMQLSMFKSL